MLRNAEQKNKVQHLPNNPAFRGQIQVCTPDWQGLTGSPTWQLVPLKPTSHIHSAEPLITEQLPLLRQVTFVHPLIFTRQGRM